MNNMIVTGIGSRSTPGPILQEMRKIGRWCRDHKVYLRSGHAEGADINFENGAQNYCLVYLPWEGFNSKRNTSANMMVVEETSELIAMTEKYHPNPKALSPAARQLMNRNVHQVLGKDLNSPTRVVICWTPDGKASGGTGQAIRIAEDYKIPVLNMQHEQWNTAEKVIEYLEKLLY